ncbi:MAG: hypothetical protein MZW92_04665 [Comamonadaceae bacterium]|nr:hypothetical protein [Comamonadaceae bacterium]
MRAYRERPESRSRSHARSAACTPTTTPAAPRSPATGRRRGWPTSTGYLKAGGYTDVHFVDAMTAPPRRRRRCARRSAELQPDDRRLHRDHAGDLQGRSGCCRSPRRWTRPSSRCSAASTAPSCTRRCCRRRRGSTPWCAARASRCS